MHCCCGLSGRSTDILWIAYLGQKSSRNINDQCATLISATLYIHPSSPWTVTHPILTNREVHIPTAIHLFDTLPRIDYSKMTVENNGKIVTLTTESVSPVRLSGQ